MNSLRSYISTAFSILALLVIVYSIVYSGRFIIDDEHILAARAISLASDNHVNNTRVIGNSRVFALSQLPIAAMNIEPAQTALGVPLVKFAYFLGVGQVQALFLMNIWVTALTAVILFLTTLIKGYSKLTALVLSLLFGLCTIVFPYTRTFFRDPLAMFFLASAWMCVSAILHHSKNIMYGVKRSLLWIGLFTSLVAGVLTKNTILIAFPVIFLELLIGKWQKGHIAVNRIMAIRSPKIWGLLLASLGSFGLIWFLVIPSISSLARFTPAYYGYLFQFFFTTPHPHLLEAFTGPFISPGKSIFIFSPVLLLSIWSLIYRLKSSWSAWLYLILLIIFQGLFYDDEWAGHINWGIRYILPAIPLLMLTLAPLVDNALTSIKGWVTILIFGSISFIIQLLGVLPPIGKYYTEVFTTVPAITEFSTIWNTKNSILIWSANWILTGKSLDIAFTRMEEKITVLLPGVVIILLIIFISLWIYSLKKLSYLAVLLCIGLNIMMLFTYKNDPIFMKIRTDLKDTQNQISENYQPGDLVLIKSYGSPAWEYWMNWTKPEIQWTALPYYFPIPKIIEEYHITNNPEVAMDNASLAILNQEIRSGKRVWLILPYDSPGANLGIEKIWLVDRSKTVTCHLFQAKNENTEMCMFIIN
jgi:hypothetical protein